ncbi:RNA polymerase sigma factor [Barnesiella viscericola]|uniref:RNA polymerase sigma factor n=1 Tax=Barnesiella viscericola TaxID=397865 RepID=UPI00255BDA18|nr:sigma-70 family RNA polymerase sigma factor [Barnesiella viscericola]
MDERKLIEACKHNDARAQRQLYETFARKMMSVCLRYADNREMAEDFLQEGFIKVFSSIRSYNYEGSFEGWIRRIFVNTALEALRKNDLLRNGVELDSLAPQQEADYSAVDRISADELLELIAQLPPGFRTVFNMFAIEGYSHREIAQALHITESTSRSQYTRAKRQLQKWINELK